MTRFFSFAFKRRREWRANELSKSALHLLESEVPVSPVDWVRASNRLALALMNTGDADHADQLMTATISTVEMWAREYPSHLSLVIDSTINLAELRYRSGRDPEARLLESCYRIAVERPIQSEPGVTRPLRNFVAEGDQTHLSLLAPVRNRSQSNLLRHYVGRGMEEGRDFALRAVRNVPHTAVLTGTTEPIEFLAFSNTLSAESALDQVLRECAGDLELRILMDLQRIRAHDAAVDWSTWRSRLDLWASTVSSEQSRSIRPLWEGVLHCASGRLEEGRGFLANAAAEAHRTSDRSMASRLRAIWEGYQLGSWPLRHSSFDQPPLASRLTDILDDLLSFRDEVEVLLSPRVAIHSNRGSMQERWTA